MRGDEAVVAHCAGRGKADVDDGGPALELVMMIAVKEIGSADGRSNRSSFDADEGSVIVHHIVGEKNLLATAAAHVERGEVVEGPRGGEGGEKSGVLFVPKAMHIAGLECFEGGFRCWSGRFVLRAGE